MVVWLWVVGGIIALVVLIALYYYNRFVVLENRIDNSMSQIDVQLKKRADLVPNLVQTIKGYAKHEKELFDKITKARASLMAGGTLSEKVKAGDTLQGFLSRLIAIAESNPQIKANENFLQLQEELSAIEDKVAYARQYYNDSVLEYENASEQFPGVFFFNMYGRTKKEYLKIPSSEKVVPKVEF